MYTNQYKQNELQALPQNQLEARTLIKAASMLDRVKNNWHELHKTDLVPALENNRRLWTILSSELAEDDHPMELGLRQNLINLAYFIFKHTIKVMADKEPKAKDIQIFITINMEVAKGLNEQKEPEEYNPEQTEISDDNQNEPQENEEQSEISEEDEEEENISSNFTV